jgi:hypothetical protein
MKMLVKLKSEILENMKFKVGAKIESILAI